MQLYLRRVADARDRVADRAGRRAATSRQPGRRRRGPCRDCTPASRITTRVVPLRLDLMTGTERMQPLLLQTS
jgi:hypothetical protein